MPPARQSTPLTDLNDWLSKNSTGHSGLFSHFLPPRLSWPPVNSPCNCSDAPCLRASRWSSTHEPGCRAGRAPNKSADRVSKPRGRPVFPWDLFPLHQACERSGSRNVLAAPPGSPRRYVEARVFVSRSFEARVYTLRIMFLMIILLMLPNYHPRQPRRVCVSSSQPQRLHRGHTPFLRISFSSFSSSSGR
jgi:hypothetical protein